MGEDTGIRSEIHEAILSLDDVQERKSRFGDTLSFFVGRREFAHFHGNQEIDLRLTRKGIQKLKQGPEDSRVEFRSGVSDWVVLHFQKRDDIPWIVELVTQARDSNWISS